jgi:hypothetical protein
MFKNIQNTYVIVKGRISCELQWRRYPRVFHNMSFRFITVYILVDGNRRLGKIYFKEDDGSRLLRNVDTHLPDFTLS